MLFAISLYMMTTMRSSGDDAGAVRNIVVHDDRNAFVRDAVAVKDVVCVADVRLVSVVIAIGTSDKKCLQPNTATIFSVVVK